VILGSVEEMAAMTGGIVSAEALEKESVLCLSAAHEAALRSLAEGYVEYLRETRENFRNVCHTAKVGRARLAYGVALRANTAQAAASMLAMWLSGELVEGLTAGAVDEIAAAGVGVPNQLRKVELPVYPFQRKRFWFGDSPQTIRKRETDGAWQGAVATAKKHSEQGPLGWKVDAYPERWKALKELTRAHAQNVLAAAGIFSDANARTVDEVLHQGGFLPIYRNLIQRWLQMLVDAGILLSTGDGYRVNAALQPVDLEPCWQKVALLMAGEDALLAYLRRCGSLLGDVLTGRTGALETLFPDGSFALAEGLYETSPGARYINSIVASALGVAAQGVGKKRNARILEIGGGTGGTTAAVLRELKPDQVEYWFTDVSDLFLNRARRKFSAYPFVRYALFDIDREAEEQKLAPGSFDLILAANVMHAARDLELAFDRVRHLLRAGGILILLETTHHHSMFDMSIGLIEGWQHFADAERQQHPLLTSDQWRALLERTGFEEKAIVPEPDSPAAHLGQHVILARCSQTGTSEARESGMAKQVAESGQVENSPASDLLKLAPELRQERILTVVRQTICSVFQLDTPPEALGERDRLSDLGMDSLIALELRSELSKRLGAGERISSTIAFDTGTVGELARSLTAILVPVDEEDSYEVRSRLPLSSRAEPAMLTAEQLAEISDEEVEQLLKERLSRQ
jgi:SAM-dependent methyltransferase/acyl carrier protein